jgi:glycosyltransferase involved in cell wall biosynthesis
VSECLQHLRSLRPDLVHIQYPTVGFGTNLGPQAVSLLKNCVATLHEASGVHILRKLALFPFSFRARHIIFPSSFERRFALTWAPWISRRSSVIAVPSNIGVAARHRERSLREILHFGLIMPKKGLEEVIKLGALIRESGLPLRVRIIGSVRPEHVRYFAALRSVSSQLPITWENGLDKEQVEDRLAASAVAYLPYPDGASERRATLKAMLVNGVAVVTTRGPQTPPDLEGCARFVHSPEQALVAASDLLKSREDRGRLTSSGAQYAGRYTWGRIAEQHAAVYDQVLAGRHGRALLPVKSAAQGTSSLPS